MVFRSLSRLLHAVSSYIAPLEVLQMPHTWATLGLAGMQCSGPFKHISATAPEVGGTQEVWPCSPGSPMVAMITGVEVQYFN